jgi:glycosyltransferase involved in cell wall biosynthesis
MRRENLVFRYGEKVNDHNAYPLGLVDSPPRNWSYESCRVTFDAVRGRPWGYFHVEPGELIHASSVIPTNKSAWLLDTDHFEYLTLQARPGAGSFSEAFARAVSSPLCLGIVAWSAAAAQSVREACAPYGVDPRLLVVPPAVVPPAGVPAVRRDLRHRGDPVRLLVVDGQIGYCAEPGRKNVRAVLDAFQVLRAAERAVELVVVDPAEPVPPMPGVRVTPHLPRAELFGLLDQTDILLFLSRQDSFGYVLLEAMSRGVCCVAATAPSLPAVPEILDDDRTGFLVRHRTGRVYPEYSDDLDTDALMTVLFRLVDSPELRESTTRAAMAECRSGGRFAVDTRDRSLRDFVQERLAAR